ncbi:hypothetical protein J6590_082436 [Homalodisca vitripennis]|nr:hypothetical protein J6590_082436 [Homalodisca vitripennis]
MIGHLGASIRQTFRGHIEQRGHCRHALYRGSGGCNRTVHLEGATLLHCRPPRRNTISFYSLLHRSELLGNEGICKSHHPRD